LDNYRRESREVSSTYKIMLGVANYKMHADENYVFLPFQIAKIKCLCWVMEGRTLLLPEDLVPPLAALLGQQTQRRIPGYLDWTHCAVISS
jgi:hypothetical protein